MKDGETIRFNDHWDKEYNKLDNLGQAMTGDMDFVLGHGSTEVKSKGDFTATRKGNEIFIQGTVEHGMNDTYDFDGDEYGGAARLLEKHKGAKPFKIKAGWKQRVRATVKVAPGNSLSVDRKSVKWEDVNE